MNNPQTPKPGSTDYNVDKPEALTTPKFHSSTDSRTSKELPAIENLNDQSENMDTPPDQDTPKPNLGNKRSADEDQRDKII